MHLDGKVILVTGAAVRLGAEIARSLASRGARVAVHHRSSEDEARALADELGGETFHADLADPEQAAALPARVAEAMGGLDGLVNSAAVFERAPFGEVTPEDFAFHMDVNLRAPLLLTQAFWKRLGEDGEGRVVNLSDARGEVLDANYPSYSLSKAGLLAMTRGLAVALAPRVRVLGLVLGYMLPPVDQPEAKVPSDVLVPGYAPAGTTGEAVAYLMGPGDFATGAVLHLDGGRHLHSPGGKFRP